VEVLAQTVAVLALSIAENITISDNRASTGYSTINTDVNAGWGSITDSTATTWGDLTTDTGTSWGPTNTN
jgi:hypothetical protein